MITSNDLMPANIGVLMSFFDWSRASITLTKYQFDPHINALKNVIDARLRIEIHEALLRNELQHNK